MLSNLILNIINYRWLLVMILANFYEHRTFDFIWIFIYSQDFKINEYLLAWSIRLTYYILKTKLKFNCFLIEFLDWLI